MTTDTPASKGPATKKDYEASIAAGLFIGFLIIPILATALPDLYSRIWPAVMIFFLVAAPAGIFIASKLYTAIPLIWQVAKFVLIGGLNTLVDIGILAALMSFFKTSAGVDPDSTLLQAGMLTITFYFAYKAISFLVANVNSFFWNKHWTFSGNPTKNGGQQFVQFLIVSVIGFLINIFFTSFIFTSVSHIGAINASQWGLICGAIGSIAGLAWNFIGYKLLVFKK
jgi:putative flippase GtrA